MKDRIIPLLVRGMALGAFTLFVVAIIGIDSGMGPISARGYAIYAALTAAVMFFMVLVAYASLRARLLYFGLYAACLTVAYLLPLSPCEPLVNALNRVRPGMTRAEVVQIMQGFPGGSYCPTDTEEDFGYKHSTDMASDCYGDCASIKLVNGHVVETHWVRGD